ncbi:DNA topoisomerase III [Vibrio pectenicida]|uniref:DNA topoisomerase n=1 Tax=Vibrio pectenicida TaxID=62763 RepID=A0A427TVT9_9VIBR|nr:DNA topoisomerase 3 [Vibrio pectenicida]RSD28569.1 DNA topoisomerase III [Vibrio pectenicida]
MRVFLCEKPTQGRDIAKVLGCNEKLEGALKGQGAVVTWGFGHLLSLADPDEYNESLAQWSLDDLPILPSPWKMVVGEGKSKQVKVIARLLKQAKEVVIATDADREGEVIARELLEFSRYQGPVQRLWLSALDEASVRKALTNLKPDEETWPLYQAGLARSRADWLLGMNLTRLCTLIGRQLGYQSVLSVGRVQTPTLRLVVERDRAIAQFVSAAFYQVKALVHPSCPFTMQWQVPEGVGDEQGRCLSKECAQATVSLCQSKMGEVIEAQTKRTQAKPPALFYLGTLQKAMSSRYGYSAKAVLDGAQALYETHKLTTYPRTDCAFLPCSQQDDIAAIFNALRTHNDWKEWASQADQALKSACWNDKKVAKSAHHAIIPTPKIGDLSRLSQLELHLYQAIVQRYLAQFYPIAEDDTTTVVLDCMGERFKAKGKIERVKGWRALMSGDESDTKADQEEQPLPVLTAGMMIAMTSLDVVDKKTSPPSHYTEGTLLDAMANIARSDAVPEQFKSILKETAGLGTEATRADVIENLKGRAFIEAKGKSLISSASGQAFITALPNEISSPVMTALWEQGLDGIEQGQDTLDGFMHQQTQFVSTLVEKMKNGTISLTLPKVEQPKMSCPLCQKTMRLVQGKSQFWACEGKDTCGLILDHVRGKVVKHQPCSCGQGVLIRRTGKKKGVYYWGCSAWKKGCQLRNFDNKGKLGERIPETA